MTQLRAGDPSIDGPDPFAMRTLSGRPEAFVRRMEDVLREGPERPELPSLVARTGWPEATVVRVLDLLRERGEVREERDPASGRIRYAIAALPPRNLGYRLRSLLR